MRPLEEGGWWSPGTIGPETHEGTPLSVDEIKALPEGTEVIITWSGGNGPHRYRMVRDQWGTLCTETMHAFAGERPTPFFKWDDQHIPLHRVTVSASRRTREPTDG
jgi:hypothetical protein